VAFFSKIYFVTATSASGLTADHAQSRVMARFIAPACLGSTALPRCNILTMEGVRNVEHTTARLHPLPWCDAGLGPLAQPLNRYPDCITLAGKPCGHCRGCNFTVALIADEQAFDGLPPLGWKRQR
jgi:hypothetical protein